MESTNSNHFTGTSVTETRFLTSTRLFGTCASWMLLSFVIVQASTYFYHSWTNDSKFLRSIVCIVIFLQLVETGAESYAVYAVDAAGWGDPESDDKELAIVVDDLQPILASLTGFIVQCFFTWRIWSFAAGLIQNPRIRMIARFVCVAIALISGLSLGTGFIIGIMVSTSSSGDIPWFELVYVLWNVSSAVADIIITVCMMALLLRARASSYFEETRDLLSRLLRLILQTGLLTSALALLSLALFLGHLIQIFTLPVFVLGKSYVISLLANLNARRRSNAPVVHSSDYNQSPPDTELSTVLFASMNRRTGEGVNCDSITISQPDHSVVRSNSQLVLIKNADIAEKSDQDTEAKSDPLKYRTDFQTFDSSSAPSSLVRCIY